MLCEIQHGLPHAPDRLRVLQCVWNRRGCRWAALLTCLFGLAWWIAAAVVATGARQQHAASAWALLSCQSAALLIGQLGFFMSLLRRSHSHRTDRCGACLPVTLAVYGKNADDAGVPSHSARTAVWAMAWASVGLWA